MSNPNPTPVKRDFYAFITNSTGDKIWLLKADDNTWTLPYWGSTQAFGINAYLPWVLESVRKHFGLETTMLQEYDTRRVYEGETLQRVERVLVLELQHGNPDTAQGKWIGPDAITSKPFANPHHAKLAQEWLQEYNGGPLPAHRAAWARPGWYGKVSKWVNDFVTGQGWQLTGPIEQRRANVISAQLLIPTTTGNLYLKALPPYASHEAVFGPLMENILPGQVPHLLATEVNNGWLLTSDFKGRSLSEFEDIAVWQAALREFAALQIKCAPHIEQLLTAGAGDRRLDKLAAQIAAALQRDDIWQIDTPQGLRQSELDQLRASQPRLQSWCDELASFGLPASVDSGDFHPDNVAVTASGFVFYDWSEMIITHPFFSLNAFQEYLRRFGNATLDWQTLTQAYLEPWLAFLPLSELDRAYQLAYKLGHAAQMLAYIWIHDGIEPRDYASIDPQFNAYAKALLAALNFTPPTQT